MMTTSSGRTSVDNKTMKKKSRRCQRKRENPYAAAHADTTVPKTDAHVMTMLLKYHRAKYTPGMSNRRA